MLSARVAIAHSVVRGMVYAAMALGVFGGADVPCQKRWSARIDFEEQEAPRGGGLACGVDFLPLIQFSGLQFPKAASTGNHRVLFGGRLGTSQLVDPATVRDEIVILLPPSRRDGLPDYQLALVAQQLELYSSAAAVLVVTLDLIPPEVKARATVAAVGVSSSGNSPLRLPPTVAVSQAAASALLDLFVEGAKPGYYGHVKASLHFDLSR